MTLEIPNSNEQKQRPHRPSLFSIKDAIKKHQDKKDFEVQEIINKNKEKYKFLEEVSNWEEKLNLYNLSKYYLERLKDGNPAYNYPDIADIEAREINEKFNTNLAKSKKIQDPMGRSVYVVNIENMPTTLDFGDILDSNNNLLPSKFKN